MAILDAYYDLDVSRYLGRGAHSLFVGLVYITARTDGWRGEGNTLLVYQDRLQTVCVASERSVRNYRAVLSSILIDRKPLIKRWRRSRTSGWNWIEIDWSLLDSEKYDSVDVSQTV